MRDEPARDAVKRGLLDTFRGAWTDSEYEATFGPAADAVLATLGIPPTTTVSEISAGLWFLAHAGSVDVSQRQGGTWVARDRDRYSIRGVGASPAAAIHALAAKLAEAQR